MVGDLRCFGLTSAVGLDYPFARRADHTRRKQLALKAERKLHEIIGDIKSSDAILAALHQLQPRTAESHTPRR